MERKHHLRTVRNKTSLKLDYILLGVILLTAAVLRLWKLGQVPFMHDEFSALFRLRFDNFRDLIQYGVSEGDSHPAGVQVFLYYWTKLVGWNPFWVKLPFVLMGIASNYLIYLIGRQWFNSKVGLLSAAFFAVSQLTVFYSQLARPYAAGLFFVLLMVYFWNKILFDLRKPSVSTCIGFAVSACLAALAHNFSTAQAGLIFLTGLFYLKKERRRAYWLSGLGALVLYAPHFPVFYQQTFVNGGIGGWLARPELSFLPNFFCYTMNYAPLFYFALGFIIILPFVLRKAQRRRYPIRWAAVGWFVIIFVMAYAYSLLREPIIQYSTMIFSFPFLVITAFSLFRNNTMTKTQTVVVIAAILFIGVSSLVVNRRHYDLMYHQGYDQIAVRMQEDHDSIDDIRFATYTESAKVPEFYQSQTTVTRRHIFDYDNDLSDLRQWLQDDASERFGFGWTDYADPKWETQAVAYYPWQIQNDTWFTSRYLSLAEDSVPGARRLLHPLSRTPFYFTGGEWSKPMIVDVDSLDTDTDAVGIVATVWAADTIQHCVVVMEVHEKDNDSLLLWHGSGREDGWVVPGENRLAAAVRFDEKKYPVKGKYIKTYLWNPDKGVMTLTGLDCYVTQFNSRLTGLYEPLYKTEQQLKINKK